MLLASKEREGRTRVALLPDASGREAGAALTPGQAPGCARDQGCAQRW